MINEFHVQNYKALRDVKLKLTPMHVLIGPNDSGKTSILEALGALCRSVEMPLDEAFQGRWTGRELVSHGEHEPMVTLQVHGTSDSSQEFDYTLDVRFSEVNRSVQSRQEILSVADEVNRHSTNSQLTFVYSTASELSPTDVSPTATIRNSLQNAHQYHWKPRNLALPAGADSQRQFRMEQSGFGLAQFLDDIAGSDPARYMMLQDRFRRIFPSVASFKLLTTRAYSLRSKNHDEVEQLIPQDGRGLFFQFEGVSKEVPASQVSDGLLLILAYLTLLFSPKPPRLLLIEEPENGIHPERLKEVINVLRELIGENGKTQVIMTTHSPYVVDFFRPDEITLCVKNENGVINTRKFSDIEKVRKQSRVFTMGEIWTGVGDAELLADETNPTEAEVESEVTTP